MQFNKNTLTATPWKNGGGVTREVAVSDVGRGYWRMSIADVDKDGEFSMFPGLSRILTVVQGHGMQLIGDKRSLTAAPSEPVSFNGDEPIRGRLVNGAVQNFNLVYDPKAVRAQVVTGPIAHLQRAIITSCDVAMIFCLAETIETTSAGLLQANSGAFIANPVDFDASNECAVGLWIGLTEIP